MMTKATAPIRHPRFVSRNDGLTLKTIGSERALLSDFYARLLATKWWKMIAALCGVYLGINFIFACFYYAVPGSIQNARPGSVSDAFFFSVQTLATIGYGGLMPQGLYANTLVTIESMFAFAFYGIVTGLVFTRFARPTARVLFSDKAVIGTHDGHRHFMLRLANQRNNRVVDAHAKLTLMRDERTKEGQSVRRFYPLKLTRDEIPLLRLTWTLHHRIDENSPLYNVSPEQLRTEEAEIIVTLNGLDETFSQNIHARHSYIADEITIGAIFEDILKRREDYVLEVRYDKFHDIKLETVVAGSTPS